MNRSLQPVAVKGRYFWEGDKRVSALLFGLCEPIPGAGIASIDLLLTLPDRRTGSSWSKGLYTRI
jgi:hypothetical protein